MFGAERPNVVVIVADDLGYSDVGVQGNKDVPTPHIDSIAGNGLRFTSGYVSCPVCSPTRAGLMTGRYQQRFGHEFNPGPLAPQNFGLPLTEKTIGDRMKALGYTTGWIGKSHLGNREDYLPQKRGFDQFFGFLGGAHDYFAVGAGNNALVRGDKSLEKSDGYLTETLASEACAFIESNKTKPFLLYLPFNAVHMPAQAPEKYYGRVREGLAPSRRTYCAMIAALDDGVGAVLGKLRETKLEENTLVFFISDNGGSNARDTSTNGALRAKKGSVYDGGVRVVWMMQWKGHVPAGVTDDRPVIALDIYPTAVAAAGGEIKPDWKLDGVNLLPFVTGGNKAAPHEALYWRFGAQGAIRQGGWKLVKPSATEDWQLYHLARDIGEQTNLVAQESDRAKSLQTLWEKWNGELAKPMWQGRGGAAKQKKKK